MARDPARRLERTCSRSQGPRHRGIQAPPAGGPPVALRAWRHRRPCRRRARGQGGDGDSRPEVAGMRIWILNHYASPPDRPAGTRHYELGRLLAGWGHDVTIFASSFSHFSRAEERLAPGERMRAQVVDGVRFVWIRTTPYSGNDHRRVLNLVSYAAGAVRAQRTL